MNISLWILCGGAVGWIAFAVFHANARLGLLASLGIGAFGGLLGGMMIAPMLGAVVDPVNAIRPFSLVVALAIAAACLIISHLLFYRSR
jgi:uncharacterized membrane protein YeaQ/YmgE (transglycosylase-associated protein family)